MIVLALSSPAWGQQTTKAVVKAPESVPAGGTVILDARGSVTDAAIPLKWQAVDPAGLLIVTFDKDGRKDVVGMLVTEPGVSRDYLVSVTAVSVDSASKSVSVDTSLCRVHAESTGPAPPQPGPTPASTAYQAGLKYGPILGSTYAEAWDAAATALEQGKTVADAQRIIQQTWQDCRSKQFTAYVTPVLQAVLPEGTEPSDPVRRSAVIQAWRDFASGLKGASK